jgi:hypothetical protein
MKFKDQKAYPDVDVTLVRKIENDDPHMVPDEEMYYVLREDGTEVIASRKDFDEKEFAEAEKAMSEKASHVSDARSVGTARPDASHPDTSRSTDANTRPTPVRR